MPEPCKKVMHATEAEAARHAHQVNEFNVRHGITRPGGRAVPYYCPECAHFHIGRTPKRLLPPTESTS
jgi:hypothetical protein